VIPGFALLKRVSNEWLIGRVASILFGLSGFLTLAVTLLWIGVLRVSDTNLWEDVLLGIFGAGGVLGAFFIWAGMWQYWVRIDESSASIKRIWFIVLLFGIWYGGIIYYLVQYTWRDRRGRSALTSVEDL
jgi:hypothetical protein